MMSKSLLGLDNFSMLSKSFENYNKNHKSLLGLDNFGMLSKSFENYNKNHKSLLGLDNFSMLSKSFEMSKSLLGLDNFGMLSKSFDYYYKKNKSVLNNFSMLSKSLDTGNILKSWSDNGWSDNYKDQMLSITEKTLENRFAFSKIIEQVIDKNVERNENFTVSTDGTITIDEIVYQPSEVTNAFTTFKEMLSKESKIEQNIGELFYNSRQQHPVIMWIIASIIVVILGVCSGKISATPTPTVIQNFNITIESVNPQYTINTIVKISKALLIEQTLINNYKFVSIKSLKVYNSKSSVQFIRELKFGQAVTILKKRRKWAIIETYGSDGEYINGWVRNKYLK